MANNGTYGIKKPAFITSNDVDIYYFYRPSRSTDSNNFTMFKLLDSSLLSTVKGEEVAGDTGGITLPGMYNLRLPVDKFGLPGIYTIYIKPKELNATILDVSWLAAYTNIRGIVLDSSTISTKDTSIFNNGGLVGYRVDYFSNGERIDMSRLITSSNRCEPVTQNFNSPNGNPIKYVFNDSSNLIFCTLTPSTNMSFENGDNYNANSNPPIGVKNQTIKLVSTKFNPVCLEIEMTTHDIEDVATMLEGDQLRNLDYGLISTFNKDGEIYHQANYGHVVNKSIKLNADFKVVNDQTNINNDEKENMKKIKQQL